MAKIAKCTFPSGHGPSDFKCFGPPATKDDEFEGTKIADLGCFNQDGGVDSNKRYHGAVVKSTIDGKWYLYTEWTRTGSSNAQFQFEEAYSEAEADSMYVKKMKSKNIKRGVWKDIPGLGNVLRPKEAKSGKPKDVYLVRPLEKRTTGLPDGQTIMAGGGSKSVPVVAVKKTKKKTKTSRVSFDPQTLSDEGHECCCPILHSTAG